MTATVEVIYNPTYQILQMLIFLVCITAITFIAILLICGLRVEDMEEPDE